MNLKYRSVIHRSHLTRIAIAPLACAVVLLPALIPNNGMTFCSSAIAQDDPAAPAATPAAPAATPAAPAATTEPAAAAVPQGYESIDIAIKVNPNIDPDSSEGRDEVKRVRYQIAKFRKRIMEFLEGRAQYPDVQDIFPGWFERFEIAQMTQTDDETVSRLGELRNEFFKDYFATRVTANGRRAVIETTLPTLIKIVSNDGQRYHPAVRMNAMLMIGRFDTTAADRQNKRPPVPTAKSLTFMLSVFNNGAFPPELRIGAMTGICRHVNADSFAATSRLPDAEKGIIYTEALAIAGGGTALDEWPEDGRYWMTRLAVQALGDWGEAGNDGAVIDALSGIIADNNRRMMLQLDAVEALGKINFIPVAAEANAIPALLAKFVADSADAEAQLLRKKLTTHIEDNILFGDIDLLDRETAGGGRTGGGGHGSMMGDRGPSGGSGFQQDDAKKVPHVEIANYHLSTSRHRMKVIAQTVKSTLEITRSNGFPKTVNDPTATQTMTGLINELDKLITESDIGMKNEMPSVVEFDEPDSFDDGEEAPQYNSTALKMAVVFEKAAAEIRWLAGGRADAVDSEAVDEFDGDEFGG